MSVLACIDRSDFAASVCDHAVWGAQRLDDAAIELLHVIERRREPAESRDHSGRLGVDMSESLLQELAEMDEQRNRLTQQAGRHLLEDAAQRLQAAGVAHVSQRLLHGELVDHLKEHEAGVSLVVVGKQGETAHQAKEHLGRNLERVIRASYRPVLIAPSKFQPIRRFVFAYDGGKSSGRAISYLVETGMLNGLEGHMLFVGDGNAPERVRLADAVRHLRGAGIQVTEEIRAGNVPQMITDAVEKEGVDLLVMGAYGHSHIRNLIIGSTTTEVIRTSKVATLVCR